jgi:nucleotide-binding universal stress UspA family protein
VVLNERIRSVVVAVDFSDTAFAGALWACTHVCPSAKVTLLHVVDPPDRPTFAAHILPPASEVEAIAREDAWRRMRAAAARFTPTPNCEVRAGKPHEETVRAATDLGADLIIIGPHGDRPRPSRFLGTTAERIVRTSEVPVLVTTQPPRGKPRRLLVPVDDAPVTARLLEWTRDAAEAFDADVTLLHVWGNAVYSHVASMSFATERDEAAARAEIERELSSAAEQWLTKLARTGIKRERVTSTVSYGNAGDLALELAEATRSEMILIGRHGRSLLAPAMLGSTIGTVLHGARCPVLVIGD